MKIIIANWKMNPQTADEAKRLALEIERGFAKSKTSNVEAVVSPPHLFIPVIQNSLRSVKLGAQNVSFETAGPFTGEISAPQLAGLSVKYVIVGHSERRKLGEDNKMINQKLKLVIVNKMSPILCVGYGTKKQSSAAAVKRIIAGQIRTDLKGIAVKSAGLVIAYEPVWAISRGLGTGKPVEPAHAAEIIKFIKKTVPSARGIYGGSLDARNSGAFSAFSEIEGGLVGGASLRAREFLSIIDNFNN